MGKQIEILRSHRLEGRGRAATTARFSREKRFSRERSSAGYRLSELEPEDGIGPLPLTAFLGT